MNAIGTATKLSSAALLPNSLGARSARSASRQAAERIPDLEKRLGELLQKDPEQAKRLGVLLSALAKMNPKQLGNLLDRIEKTLQAFSGSAQSQSGVSAPSAPTPAPMEGIRFSLDFEVTVSMDITSIVAEMREQGMNVQTTQISATQTVSLHIEFSGAQGKQQKSDPLVLDLGGDGIQLSGAADGERFDINGDGRADRTAFVRGNDAFLARDRNGNGAIDDGTELFGDQNGAANGFEELAKYDDNEDGIINKADSIFRSLLLLHDKNGDGRVERTETSTLAGRGIDALYLQYRRANYDDRHGNTLVERSFFTSASGERAELSDAWLTYQ